MLIYNSLFVKVNDSFLEINECDDGYDFTLYDKYKNLIDGGVLECDDFMEEEDLIRECLDMLDLVRRDVPKYKVLIYYEENNKKGNIERVLCFESLKDCECVWKRCKVKPTVWKYEKEMGTYKRLEGY